MSLTEAELKGYVLNLLARRDYSERELRQKLKQKEASVEDIERLLAWSQQQGYQSDSRYAEQMTQAKVRKGYGQYYLQQFFAEQGLSKELLQQVIETKEIDWVGVASDAYRKKYADKPITDYHDKQKRMKYLQSRGFESQVIQQLFKQLQE